MYRFRSWSGFFTIIPLCNQYVYIFLIKNLDLQGSRGLWPTVFVAVECHKQKRMHNVRTVVNAVQLYTKLQLQMVAASSSWCNVVIFVCPRSESVLSCMYLSDRFYLTISTHPNSNPHLPWLRYLNFQHQKCQNISRAEFNQRSAANLLGISPTSAVSNVADITERSTGCEDGKRKK